MSAYPVPEPEKMALSQALQTIITAKIKAGQGFLPFAAYMDLVLYFPRYGYYAHSGEKFGAGGDFITAPETHDLFAATLARQLMPLLAASAKNIYEFGAGTGKLAADLLRLLPPATVENYFIIDLSGSLKARQTATVSTLYPPGLKKIRHLTSLPAEFNGVILANEVLDAMPCALIKKDDGQYYELGVGVDGQEHLIWRQRPLTNPALHTAAAAYLGTVPEPYITELHLRQTAFINTVAAKMNHAAAVFIDYGFTAGEYYRPHRRQGTLIGHYRHRTVTDPFLYPGLVDLTCHVNFTAVAEAAVAGGAELMGYCSQSNFLLNLGITQLLAERQQQLSEREYIKAAAACHLFLDPAAMGETFKVIAFAKNTDLSWQGFSHGDWTHKL